MPPFTHRIRVRYNECDQQNAVFNANYLTYFDVTLTELWRESQGSYGAMASSGVDLVVAECNVRYLRPAHFDDELDVGMEIERLGTTAMTTRFTVRRGEDVLTEGTMRHVFVDITTGKKIPIPDETRVALEPYSDAG